MSGAADQKAESGTRAVTSSGRRSGLTAAERKRHQRERDKQLIYETEDWRLFTDQTTLPQKAGCQPAYLGEIVLKELVDNALEAGANVRLDCIDGTWIVCDDGPGLDPADVPRLFSVNRPLLSSKLKRLPLRGMLGNGLRVVVGAVAALGGTIAVSSRGHGLELKVDRATGKTIIASDTPVPDVPGTEIEIALPGRGNARKAADRAILIAEHYRGS